MLRYILSAIAVLGFSACTDNTDAANRSSGPDHKYDIDDTPRSDEDIRKDDTPTAGDQSESDSDRRITQQIRQAVVDDQEMSVKAENVTIVTIDGIVTLRGTVDSVAERQSIERKANGASGVRRIENNLEVAR